MGNRFVTGEFFWGRAAKWRKGSDSSAPGINQWPLFSPLRRAYTRSPPLLQLAAVNRRRRENGKKIKRISAAGFPRSVPLVVHGFNEQWRIRPEGERDSGGRPLETGSRLRAVEQLTSKPLHFERFREIQQVPQDFSCFRWKIVHGSEGLTCMRWCEGDHHAVTLSRSRLRASGNLHESQGWTGLHQRCTCIYLKHGEKEGICDSYMYLIHHHNTNNKWI